MSERLWKSMPQEPRWNVYLPDDHDIQLASATWHSVIRHLVATGQCPLVKRHLVKQLCFARVCAERSTRIVKEKGAATRSPFADDVIYSPHWVDARKAQAMMRRLERHLSLTLC